MKVHGSSRFQRSTIGLSELSSEQLQEHFRYLLAQGGEDKNGLAPRTVNSVRTLILAALRLANKKGLTSTGFDGETKPMAVDRTEMHTLTEKQSNDLIATAKRENFIAWCIIIIALGTGMRIGEIFGLNWDSINLNDKTLIVQRSVVSTNEGPKLQNTLKRKSSFRTIPLPSNVVDALKEFAMCTVGSEKATTGFLFQQADGRFMDPANFSYKTFKKLLKLAGISKEVRFHDLRHTHASLLLAKGINIKVISSRLGHASIRITLDTYSHIMPNLQEDAINALDSMFANPKEE